MGHSRIRNTVHGPSVYIIPFQNYFHFFTKRQNTRLKEQLDLQIIGKYRNLVNLLSLFDFVFHFRFIFAILCTFIQIAQTQIS